MNQLFGLARFTAIEFRLVLRESSRFYLPLALPLIILAMNGMGDDARKPVAEFHGLSALDAYIVPLSAVIIVTIIGLMHVPSGIAHYRRMGVLRRLSVTPAQPLMILVAHALILLIVTVLGAMLALATAFFVFGIASPRNPGGVIMAFLLSICAMFTLGLLIAALAKSPGAAGTIGLASFLALMATGGGFSNRNNYPDWLASVASYTPFGAAHEAMVNSWSGGSPTLSNYLVLLAVALIAGTGSAFAFQWE
ncbi:ABC transporter permease [Streptomyces luteogriseus]|uniref:ABC transporter permease n=1 Tax=Streptomyces luteogriseus TaxID=68233 RepID=UPI0037A7C3B4